LLPYTTLFRSIHAAMHPDGLRLVALEPVEPRAVQAQDLALRGLVEMRVLPLVLDVVRDPRAPEGLDLPLRPPVPGRVGTEHDVVLTHVVEQLADQVRPHLWERHDHRGK